MSDPMNDAVALDDSATTDELSPVVIDALANDSDPDGPAPAVAEIEGVAVAAGESIVLASGATVTLNPDGTLTYDPGGAFAWLISNATAAATGASNTQSVDSFSYTLSDGVSANVQVTVSGIVSAGDRLVGTAAGETITGTIGGDEIDGAGGADTMRGGFGDDVYTVSQLGDLAVERSGEGFDTVYSTISYSLTGQFVEALFLVCGADIDGTGNGLDNVLYGNCGTNTLYGLDGSDSLDGGGGADLLIGGRGDDYYTVDDAGDQVVEILHQGYDTVYSSVSFSLVDQYLEALILSGTGAIDGTGNSLANVIIGNDAANTLDGGAGNDELNGGLGADTMIGGAGDDLIHIDELGDLAVELANEGYDTVLASISYSLAGQYVENLTLTGGDAIDGTGNSLANTLTGNDAANTLDGREGDDFLDGGAGADVMIGGAGNDSYYVDDAGDIVLEAGGYDYDIVYASASYSLAGQYIEDLTLTGTDAIDGTGNSLNNYLTGNGAANTLSGGAGHDDIDGGAGADLMIGGDGDDYFYVDDSGDVVVEYANDGLDLVFSSVSYSLAGQYIEGLILVGTDAIDATGNSLSNALIGNDASNTLDGAAGDDQIDGGLGADLMFGGTGNDAFYVDDAGDVVVEGGNQGYDAVFSEVSYSLVGQYIEELYLMCGADIDGTGNSLDNLIVGNCGANTLDGGEGNDILDGDLGVDTMIGGLGDDTFYVDDLGDVAVEYAHGGYDTVVSSISYSLAGQYVEELVLTCGADIDGTGNKYANTLIGNCGANVLNGMEGDDTIYGGGGADMLIGGAGADGFWFDTTLDGIAAAIVDFDVAADSIHLDLAIFTGLAGEGELAAGALVFGDTAQDADDRILYDSATGNIWYDEDGAGGADAVLFAQVTAGTALTNADFLAFT